MISEYISKKLNSAKYKILKDKTYFGEINFFEIYSLIILILYH